MKRLVILMPLLLILARFGISRDVGVPTKDTRFLTESVRVIAPSVVEVGISIALPSQLQPELQQPGGNPRTLDKALGTGFMVNDRYVVTARHVVLKVSCF
jgi:S1-C subfamily serine protease